jgi:hypothetical protein
MHLLLPICGKFTRAQLAHQIFFLQFLLFILFFSSSYFTRSLSSFGTSNYFNFQFFRSSYSSCSSSSLSYSVCIQSSLVLWTSFNSLIHLLKFRNSFFQTLNLTFHQIDLSNFCYAVSHWLFASIICHSCFQFTALSVKNAGCHRRLKASFFFGNSFFGN